MAEPNFSLSALPYLTGAETRSISAENPTGEKGRGAMAVPDVNNPDLPHCYLTAHLGQGWKTRPFISVQPGQTATLMDVDGPGMIQHIWMVSGSWGQHGRGCVLRFYWDGEESPSAEAPVTDFFAVGHDKFAPVNSLAVMVTAASALNCFWPMPFRRHAKITYTNESNSEAWLVAYQITYALTPVPDNAAYFHAQYRRKSMADENPYVVLDNVQGSGKYAGTFLAIQQIRDGWFGEGEMKFYLDGDGQFPTICGTGLEDYFLSSYGFPTVFTGPYVGLTLRDNVRDQCEAGSEGADWAMYRWHIMDPVHFKQDLRITLQGLGVMGGEGYNRREDDISSVAYWYQTEPHTAFPPLPGLAHRIHNAHTGKSQSCSGERK